MHNATWIVAAATVKVRPLYSVSSSLQLYVTRQMARGISHQIDVADGESRAIRGRAAIPNLCVGNRYSAPNGVGRVLQNIGQIIDQMLIVFLYTLL